MNRLPIRKGETFTLVDVLDFIAANNMWRCHCGRRIYTVHCGPPGNAGYLGIDADGMVHTHSGLGEWNGAQCVLVGRERAE